MFGQTQYLGTLCTADEDFHYGEQAYGAVVNEHRLRWSNAPDVYYYSNYLQGRYFDHCTQGLDKQTTYAMSYIPVLETASFDQAQAELVARSNTFGGAAGLLLAQQQFKHLFPVGKYVVALDYRYRLPIDRSGNRRYAAVRYLWDPKDEVYLWDFGVHFVDADIRTGDCLLLITRASHT